MPSRRTFLASASAAAAGAVAGCSALDRGVDGYVQLKSITGVTIRDGEQDWESVLRVSLGSPPGTEPSATVDDEWAERFESAREPVVSDPLDADLQTEYTTVRYVVGVCSPEWADDEPVGCYNVATTRENFNAVQVHDRVTASTDGTTLTVHSVDGEWAFDSG